MEDDSKQRENHEKEVLAARQQEEKKHLLTQEVLTAEWKAKYDTLDKELKLRYQDIGSLEKKNYQLESEFSKQLDEARGRQKELQSEADRHRSLSLEQEKEIKDKLRQIEH